MKLLTIFISAVALLYPAASISQSRPMKQRDITIEGVRLTPAKWVSAVSKQLDSVLVYPDMAPFNYDGRGNGIVSVQFQIDANNRPIAIALARSSRNPVLDKFGMRAITRLGTLPATPSTFVPGQRFRANIIYATTYLDYERQLVVLKKEEAARRVAQRSAPDATALVLTIGAGSDS